MEIKPIVLDKVIGHDKERAWVSAALKNDKLMHAYIFSGIKGIGKKLFAMEIASVLLKAEGETLVNHPDLYLIDKEGLKVENIREVITNASMSALMGKWKVFIIDNAEELSASGLTASANTLLKTLEEPPANTLFILITDRYDMILKTIRSRCGLIKFNRLKRSEVLEVLRRVAPDESYYEAAVAKSNGSIEKALAVLNNTNVDIITAVLNKDYVKFTKEIFDIKELPTLKLAIESVYPLVLDRFKETGRYELCLLGYYMLDILKRFDYNSNQDLLKADFVSKVIEVY